MLQIIFCIISTQVYLSKVMHKNQNKFYRAFHKVPVFYEVKRFAKDITV